MAEFTLLLGANRGDPHATFAQASTLIEDRVGHVVASSRDHWTHPWGFEDDRLFLNRALLVETTKEPAEVMALLMEVEQELGRVRSATARYTARLIDIDILFIGGLVLDMPQLSVPHPRVHLRAFALAPAADLVPGLVHPVLHKHVLQLLNQVLQRP